MGLLGQAASGTRSLWDGLCRKVSGLTRRACSLRFVFGISNRVQKPQSELEGGLGCFFEQVGTGLGGEIVSLAYRGENTMRSGGRAGREAKDE